MNRAYQRHRQKQLERKKWNEPQFPNKQYYELLKERRL